jgi:hypothetical protein
MLPFRVIQIEQHWARQRNAARPLSLNLFLLTQLSSERNLALPNRQIHERLSREDFAAICFQNLCRSPMKNERIFAKWAPTSNRQWVKSRCYRKQTTKSCLTEVRKHIQVSLNFTRIAQKSEVGNHVSNRFWAKNRGYRRQVIKPRLTGPRFVYFVYKELAKFHKVARGSDELYN